MEGISFKKRKGQKILEFPEYNLPEYAKIIVKFRNEKYSADCQRYGSVRVDPLYNGIDKAITTLVTQH